jgi:ferredoxin
MNIKKIFRPPRALNEKEFVKKCARCGNCAYVCPTHAIKISDDKTPIFIGPCIRCMRCVDVCQNGALEKITKDQIKIGIAKIITKKCRAWNPAIGDCLVCWEWCPVGAIEPMAEVIKKNPKKDPREFVSEPKVNEKYCIGCATCVHACPEKAVQIHKR